jgi:autotransporter-associated beta strand protein
MWCVVKRWDSAWRKATLIALPLSVLLWDHPVRGQTFEWGGAGSTTVTSNYGTTTNWEANTPPVASGQAALFGANGNVSVNVGSAINPDAWDFSAAAQAFIVTGSTVTFGGAGIASSAANDISISNELAGNGSVQHVGASVLSLLGSNSYTGGTYVGPASALAVGHDAALGTGDLTLDAGLFRAGVGNLTVANNIFVSDVNGPSTIDANGDALTLSGNISGPGVLMVDDFTGGFPPGVVTLLGNVNVLGGIVICSCGSVQLGSSAVMATISGAISNDGLLDIVNANTTGLVSITTTSFGQTSFLNATNAGTATLTQDGGVLSFGLPAGTDTASAGNATINNINDGLTFFQASTTAGNATITNDGTGGFFGSSTIFTDNATAGNSVITNLFNGQTQFFNNSTAANARITNEAGGTLIMRDTSTLGNAVVVNNSDGSPAAPAGIWFLGNSTAGNAQIRNNAGGIIWFADTATSDAPTAGSATFINDGLIEFNSFSTGGNATIVTNSGGSTYFWDNATAGNARLAINGTGFVDFTPTLGLNGDGRVSAGSIEGSGLLYIGAGNTLAVGSNGLSTVFSGIIIDFNPCFCVTPGPGNLEKVGSGRLTLLGANTYTGTTTVFDGVLEIASGGSIVSNVTVNGGALIVNGSALGGLSIADGILGGSGTVGTTTISGNSILSPGNSIGTLTVQGNLALASSATYLVEIDPASADRTLVTGTASVAGTVRAVFAAGTYVQRNYTILTANAGVSGAFGAINVIGLPAGFAASLVYDPNNVFVTLTAVLGTPPAGPSPLPFIPLNQNQQSVATSLNNFFNSGGVLSARFIELFKLTGDSLRNALTALSGETATRSAQGAFSSVDYFLNLMLDPFVSSRGGDVASGGGPGANQFASGETEAEAYAARRKGRSPAEQDAYAAVVRKAVPRNNLLDARWSVWGAAYGGELKADGNTVVGARDASTRAFGFAAGADYRLSRDTLVGFALSGGGTSFSLAQGGGSGRSDVFQAGAFVRHNIGQGYVKGALAYGWHDVTTERTVSLAGIDRLEGRYNANSFAARGEGGYRFVTPWMGVTPYAAAQAITYFQPGYGEQVTAGLNTFALNYASRDITSARTELGVRTDKSFALQTALVTLRGRAAWAHYFDDRRSLTASFQTLAAPAFVVTGAAQARDAALVSASADVKWANGVSIAGVFEGEFSERTRGYAGKGVARYQW